MVTHYILQMLGSTFLAPVSKHFFWVSLRVCNTTLYPSVSQPMCMTAQPRSLLLSSLVSADEHQQPSFLPMSMQTYSCFTLLSQAGSHITAPLEIKADPWNKDLAAFWKVSDRYWVTETEKMSPTPGDAGLWRPLVYSLIFLLSLY